MDFEARGAKRFASEHFMAFRLYDDSGHVTQEGMVTTLDISRTGVAIKSSLPMENGARIELTIGIGDDVVKTRGRVKNQKELADKHYQIGIEFDFLSDEDLNRIGMVYPNILR